MVLLYIHTLVIFDDITVNERLLQLQGGGDMSALKNFNTSAVRQGFIVDDVSNLP